MSLPPPPSLPPGPAAPGKRARQRPRADPGLAMVEAVGGRSLAPRCSCSASSAAIAALAASSDDDDTVTGATGVTAPGSTEAEPSTIATSPESAAETSTPETTESTVPETSAAPETSEGAATPPESTAPETTEPTADPWHRRHDHVRRRWQCPGERDHAERRPPAAASCSRRTRGSRSPRPRSSCAPAGSNVHQPALLDGLPDRQHRSRGVDPVTDLQTVRHGARRMQPGMGRLLGSRRWDAR